MPPRIKILFTRTNLFDAKFRKHSIVLHTAKKSVISVQMPIDSVSAVMTEKDDEAVRDLDITSDEDMDEQSKVSDTIVTMTAVKISNNSHNNQTAIKTNKIGEASNKIPQDIDEYDSGEDKSDVTISETPIFVFGQHLVAYCKYMTEWSEQSYFGKALYIIESPLILLRLISIPMLPEGLCNIF